MSLGPDEDVATQAVDAVRAGNVARLRTLLKDHPGLAGTSEVGRGPRSLLHTATDWPGFWPNGKAIVQLLLEAGADPNVRSDGTSGETPLHWAASSDDAEVADALVAGGADIDSPDGSIGTPLANAVGYGCWQVASVLLARGAKVDALWIAAALGLTDKVEAIFAASPAPSAEDVQEAFWQACHGGQPRIAQYLFARGANLTDNPGYAKGTPLSIAKSIDTRHDILVTMLTGWGAKDPQD